MPLIPSRPAPARTTLRGGSGTAALALLLGAAPALRAGTHTYTASPDALPNPERGFYSSGALTLPGLTASAAAGVRLCYFNIDLRDWRTAPISPGKLSLIRQELDHVRTAGLKAILRVTYSSGLTEPDAPLAMVQTHLAQLRPVFAEYDSIIALYQAGCVGAWGEWHSSQHLTTAADRLGVFHALLENVPPQRFIQIRTPAFTEELAGVLTSPLTPQTAFLDTPAARIALHNDCWRASATDMGTYPADPAVMAAQKDFTAAHTRYTPWGGETCGTAPPWSDGPGALEEAARFHATYLHRDYYLPLLQQWQADGTYAGLDRRLGYRLAVKSATLPDSLVLGQTFSWQITLENTGWAAPFNPRPVFLRILAGPHVLADVPLAGADPRRWLPGAGDIVLQGQSITPVDVPAAHLGFALWLPDAAAPLRARPEYSIRLANTGTWDAAAGHNLLQTGQPAGPVSPVVDGSTADWAALPLAEDPAGDEAGAAADLTGLSLASDSQRLYFRLRFHTPADWTGSARNNIYIDLDGTPATGLAVRGIGSDLLLQGTAGYLQQAGVFNAGAVTGLDFRLAPAGAAADLEFSLSRSATAGGQPLLRGPRTLSIVLESQDAGWTGREYLPGTGSFTHTLAEDTATPAAGLQAAWTPAGLRLDFPGTAARLHEVLAADSPAGPWAPAGRCLGAADGACRFLDTAAPDLRRRFYRAQTLP